MASKAQRLARRRAAQAAARREMDAEDVRLNTIADERASGPFVAVSLDDLTREG